MSDWKEIKKYLIELKRAAKQHGFDYELEQVKQALEYESNSIGRSVLDNYYERVVGYDFKLKNGIIQREWNENEKIIAQLLGIEKGEPMSFWAANEMKANPHYISGSGSGYTINCQSTVVAYELRRRGFNVEAMMNNLHKDNLSFQLSWSTNKAWIDPRTGEFPHVFTASGKMHGTLLKRLDMYTEAPGRYHISMYWKDGGGHIMTFERYEGKGLMPMIYDPQTGVIYDYDKFQDEILNSILVRNGKINIDVYRVDNLMVNPQFAGVVSKAGTTRASTMSLKGVKGGWNGVNITPLSEQAKLRRKELKNLAKPLTQSVLLNNDFPLPVKLTKKNIKEWLNQPFIHYESKNELILDIHRVFRESKYIGYGFNKDNPALKVFIFETTVEGDTAWIVVKEAQNGEVFLYSISDKAAILNDIKRRL